MIKDILTQSIKNALTNLGIEAESIVLEHPTEIKNGDYSTNIALVSFKGRRKFEEATEGNKDTINVQYGVDITNPRQLAEKIKLEIEKEKPAEISNIEVAGAGFINFYLSKNYLKSIVKKVLEDKDKWGSNILYTNKKILVEHSSPNLFKPFHVGHLMNNTIGESIVRLAKYSGADVKAMTFPSDISLGIAKAIFIILRKIDLDGSYPWDNIVVLGDAYVEGTKLYNEDESIHNRVKEIANNLYSNIDSKELSLYNQTKHFNISYFKQVVERLGSSFDEEDFIYESEAGLVGKKIVIENTPQVFTKSEGAYVYIPNKNDKHLNTAVFINSQDNPTYEAKDIGLLSIKFDLSDFKPDVSIFVTDYQQIGHFDVVLDAAYKINKKWADNSRHIPHGRMSFKGQKMSSRLGGVPIVEDILDAVIEEVQEKNSDITKEQAEIIGISAVKFTILRTAAGKDINFDPETSLSFEGGSGPYLQYTGVRSYSLIQKAKEFGLSPSCENTNSEITNIEKILEKFPGVVERSTLEWSSHHIVGYLIDLAQAFNSWYANTKIIDEENSETPYRLAIVQAVAQTLKNGLYLLGIKIPEKM